MVLTISRSSLRDLHRAIVENEAKGYHCIAPAKKIEEDKVKYRKGRYQSLYSSKWFVKMRKAHD